MDAPFPPFESPFSRRFGALEVKLYLGSILDLPADALVNPSNPRLWLGSGVSGLLRKACGPRLQEAMDAIGGVAEDGFAVTPAFDHARVAEIIHVPTVSGDAEVIETAYANVLRRAKEAGHRRVLVPALGAGVGGMSLEGTAEALLRAIEARDEDAPLELVVTLIDRAAVAAFERVLAS